MLLYGLPGTTQIAENFSHSDLLISCVAIQTARISHPSTEHECSIAAFVARCGGNSGLNSPSNAISFFPNSSHLFSKTKLVLFVSVLPAPFPKCHSVSGLVLRKILLSKRVPRLAVPVISHMSR